MHPYRDGEPPPTDPPSELEDVVVLGVLLAVGFLGLVLGVLFPDRTVEAALGLLLVFFLLRARIRERRQERRRTDQDSFDP